MKIIILISLLFSAAYSSAQYTVYNLTDDELYVLLRSEKITHSKELFVLAVPSKKCIKYDGKFVGEITSIRIIQNGFIITPKPGNYIVTGIQASLKVTPHDHSELGVDCPYSLPVSL